MEFETKKDLICSNPKYDKNKQMLEVSQEFPAHVPDGYRPGHVP